MIKETIILIDEYNDNEKIFFTDMIYYMSEYIKNIEVQENAIKVEYDFVNEQEVLNGIKLLENSLKNHAELDQYGELEIETLEDYSDKETINKQNIYEELINRKIISQYNRGSYLYSGIFLDVLKYFHLKIDEFWYSNFKTFNKKEIEVPVLMSIEDYAKGGYFQSFPHFMMFGTSLVNDPVVMSGFANGTIRSEEAGLHTKVPKTILRHAACAPIYSYLENMKLETPKSFLVSGKCFRNEGDNTFELARLNEFCMKEFVFIGTNKIIEKAIDDSKDLWKFWISQFGLNCKIDTANDSFFATEYKKLRIFQLLGDAKQEFKLLLPEENKYIAGSSINYHRTYFAKSYNIKNSQGYCHSACFAFGIERLAFALLSQKGLNKDKWDLKTLEELSKYVELERLD